MADKTWVVEWQFGSISERNSFPAEWCEYQDGLLTVNIPNGDTQIYNARFTACQRIVLTEDYYGG